MARVKLVDRPRRLEINLPQSVFEAVEKELFSDIQQRVPYGAWSALIESSLVKWLEEKGVTLQ